MTNRFLISVAAAALIAGTGFANAQGMNREGGVGRRRLDCAAGRAVLNGRAPRQPDESRFRRRPA